MFIRLNTSLFYLLFTLTLVSHITEASERTSAFTREQREDIGKIAIDYLFEHPEYLDLIEQKRQMLRSQQYEREINLFTQKVVENQAALLNLTSSPQIGPEDADVALIEFYDYQCSFCSKTHPIIMQVVEEHPTVRLIFKDWPVFAERWPVSEVAAAIGIALWQEKGSQKYWDYHKFLFRTGHVAGQLQVEDIAKVIKNTGTPVPTSEAMAKARKILRKNALLAKKIGLTSLPTFIVMPFKGATSANTTVISGEISAEVLKSAIVRAQHKNKVNG
jgi:protein-disulfide isomerase